MLVDAFVYCERVQHGLWAEPVNLVSNIGFLLAGTWALARCRGVEPKRHTIDLWGLAGLMIAIGIGSGLWHSVHTNWARQLDILPILGFIHLYLFSFLWRRAGLAPLFAALLTLVFFAASRAFASTVDPGLWNGSVFYLPALLALAALSVFSLIARQPGRWLMTGSLGLFLVSLTCRTLDTTVCETMPVGTHFAWHLLNAGVLGMLFAVVAGAGRLVQEA